MLKPTCGSMGETGYVVATYHSTCLPGQVPKCRQIKAGKKKLGPWGDFQELVYIEPNSVIYNEKHESDHAFLGVSAALTAHPIPAQPGPSQKAWHLAWKYGRGVSWQRAL